jgi:hypothetical protein
MQSLKARSGSQTERIDILKLALKEKGIIGGAHYDLVGSETASTITDPLQPTLEAENDGDGIHL